LIPVSIGGGATGSLPNSQLVSHTPSSATLIGCHHAPFVETFAERDDTVPFAAY
jgi:hypothetical protein